MADGLFEIKDFSGGLNVLDSAHLIDPKQSRIALNVDVFRGAVETTPGFTLWNHDTAKTGGIKMMIQYYKSNGDKYLVFANDDHYYSLQADATVNETWNDLGDYGTSVDNPRGFVYDDQLILGANNASNDLKKWDGTTFASTTSQPTDKVNIFEFLQGSVFAALFAAEEGQSTLYWCDTNDPDDWTTGNYGEVVIAKNDGEGIRALKAQGDTLWVIKDTRKYSVQVIYDEYSSTWLPRVQRSVEQSGGTISHDSTQVVSSGVANDLFMLSNKRKDGITSFGNPVNYGNAPLSFPVSELINPIINKINWEQAHKARAILWDRKYMLSVPFGASTTNSAIFVRHLDTKAWTIYNHVNAGSFAIFKDSNGIEELYVGDALEPKIYKYNPNRYDINNSGYVRTYRTGKLSFTNRSSIKDTLKWIDIAGAIAETTKLVITVFADEIQKSFQIDEDNIIETSAGGYIGDQFIGNEFVGGISISNSKKRFIAHIDISNLQRDFRSVEIQLTNFDPSQYWKLDYLAFDFKSNRDNLPRQSQYILEPFN